MRRAAAAGLVVGAVLALTGCGSDDGPTTTSSSATAQPADLRVVRSIPTRVNVGTVEYSVTINAMDDDPPSVTIGITTDTDQSLTKLAEGDELALGERHYKLVRLVVGDRGSADFDEVEPAAS